MPTGEKITLRAYEVVKNVEQRWSSAESDAEHSERVKKIIDSMKVVKMYFFYRNNVYFCCNCTVPCTRGNITEENEKIT